jgi:16S rRNA G966 N2-methylase RsmD
VSKKLPPEARTSLKHVGGPSEERGDPELAAALKAAFDVGEADADATRAHVHGFHSYPARLHPIVAGRLIEAFPDAKTILDPFCGSGTVLVEARLRGRAAKGTDVNPLAIRLARLKARGVPALQRKALVDNAKKIEEYARKRRVARASPTMRYPEEDVALFDAHVLLELDSIRDGIDAVHSKGLREDLELILSAILTKCSRQRGDTGKKDLQHRRLAPGFVGKMFVAKAEELSRALEEFEKRLPKETPELDVHSDDARVLGTVRAGSIDLVLSSPPYAATYDYLEHHDVRLRWLRLRVERFAELELGARRAYARLGPDRARQRWDDELGRTMSAIARALTREGTAVLVLADSAVRGAALRADEVVNALAEPAGLSVVAMTSQPRPHFHTATQSAFSRSPRREHLIALRRRG